MIKKSFGWARRKASSTTRYVKEDLLNLNEAQQHYQEFKDIAGEHVDPRNIKKGRVETFEHAMERMNLTQSDIESSYAYYGKRFNILLFFVVIALGMLGYSIFQGDIYTALIATGASLIILAQMFVASFRCYQIRLRDLVSPSVWLSNPGEWIPGPLHVSVTERRSKSKNELRTKSRSSRER